MGKQFTVSFLWTIHQFLLEFGMKVNSHFASLTLTHKSPSACWLLKPQMSPPRPLNPGMTPCKIYFTANFPLHVGLRQRHLAEILCPRFSDGSNPGNRRLWSVQVTTTGRLLSAGFQMRPW